MNKTITLFSGEAIDINWVGHTAAYLWIDGLKLNMAEVFEVFSNTENTRVIEAPGKVIHEGYTRLVEISLNEDGTIRICLEKRSE